MIRCINVGAKYGFYSDEQFEIIRNVRLRNEYITDNLVFNMILKKTPERVDLQLERSF